MEATPSARPAGASRKLPAAVREFEPRTAIEPVIGHLEVERRMGRNHRAHRAESDFHADVRGGRFQVRPDDASYSDVFDRAHSARYLSFLLGSLGSFARTVFASFDCIPLVNSTECAAATFVRRTPGWSPLVNSTPAASSARCSRSIVDCFASAPFSMRVTVLAVMPAR